MNLKTTSLTLAMSFFSQFGITENTDVIELTSLEWPPYSSKSIEQQGASVAVAKAAFEAMGYQLNVTFFPWSRAVALAKDNSSKFSGYFPEYYSTEIAREFIYSEPMGTGPLGFAERKDNAVKWSVLNDLMPYRIGIVQDYVNTAELDAMIANKTLTTSTTISDVSNLMKMANERIDLAVIDKNVMDYLFKTNRNLAKKRSLVQFNRTILENKKLYICFKKSSKGKAIAKIYNEGLTKININEIMAAYLQQQSTLR